MTRTSEFKKGVVTSMSGVLATMALIILTIWGQAKTGEQSLWQPMLVPIILTVLLSVSGLLVIWHRDYLKK